MSTNAPRRDDGVAQAVIEVDGVELLGCQINELLAERLEGEVVTFTGRFAGL